MNCFFQKGQSFGIAPSALYMKLKTSQFDLCQQSHVKWHELQPQPVQCYSENLEALLQRSDASLPAVPVTSYHLPDVAVNITFLKRELQDLLCNCKSVYKLHEWTCIVLKMRNYTNEPSHMGLLDFNISCIWQNLKFQKLRHDYI